MIHIFYTTSHLFHKRAFDEYLQQMPLDIQSRILKYRNWQDAQRSLFGKILLMKALSNLNTPAYSLEDLKYSHYQRPYFDAMIDFNISHAGEYIICAISKTHRVGVDIEQIKPIAILDFKNQCSLQEWDFIVKANNSIEEFYIIWTKKEAFIKATGEGLTIHLNEINTVTNPIIWNHKHWYFFPVPLANGYAAHIATDAVSPALIVQKISLD